MTPSPTRWSPRQGLVEIEVVSVASVDAEKALITKLFGAVALA